MQRGVGTHYLNMKQVLGKVWPVRDDLQRHLAGLLPQQAKWSCRQETQEEHRAGGTVPPTPARLFIAAHVVPTLEDGPNVEF